MLNHNGSSLHSQTVAGQEEETATESRAAASKTVHAQQRAVPGAGVTW